MNINVTRNQFVLAIVAMGLVMSLCFVLGTRAVDPIVEQVETIKYVEVIPNENFDTSVLDTWDGDFSDGKIRMIGAWLYGHDNEGNPIVVDEKGELWTLSDYSVSESDFLLLWIADNNTTDFVHDDLVLKIWTEKYEQNVIEEVG